MGQYTQDNKPLGIETPLGKDILLLEAVRGTETLSRPFSFELDMVSEEASIDPSRIVGKEVSFRINNDDNSPRWFHGWVKRLIFLGAGEKRFTRWRAEIVPGLWFLTLTSDCRIWQSQSYDQIVLSLLRDDHQKYVAIESRLQGSYAKRDYSVQYRETDLGFVSRLLEHEGIFYFFKHSQQALKMTIADSSSAVVDCADATIGPVEGSDDAQHGGFWVTWHDEWQTLSGKATQRDWNFQEPSTDLTASVKGASSNGWKTDLEVFDYPGGYGNKDQGGDATRRWMELEEVAARTIRGSSACRSFSPGYTFTKKGEGKYLLTSVTHAVDIRGIYERGTIRDGASYRNTFTCIPAAVPFHPPRATPKPALHGPQTAIVVGTSGEEIDTDQYGRVKVQFPWDRLGEKNEKSSCWVRVAQPVAGNGWGGQFIPRIGQEVVVSFLEGDPDQPLITGVVYNGTNKLPFPLPDNKTQSGLRTRSSKAGGETTFHELRFEDKKDAEEIYFHSERDFKRVVENNDSLEVGFTKKEDGNRDVKVFNDATETIGCSDAKAGSRTATVWKNDTTTVKTGDQSVTVEKGNQTVTVEKGDQTISVDTGNQTVKIGKGDQTITISSGKQAVTLGGGDASLRVKMGDRTVNVDLGKYDVTAMKEIAFKVGASSITLDQTGVTIKGMNISIEGQMQTSVKGLMTEVKASATLQAGGAITMIG